MTKVSVFGQEPKEKKELKKIEMVKYLDEDSQIKDVTFSFKSVDNVMLLSEKYCDGFDLMWAYNNPMAGHIVLGHWNDGVV